MIESIIAMGLCLAFGFSVTYLFHWLAQRARKKVTLNALLKERGWFKNDANN